MISYTWHTTNAIGKEKISIPALQEAGGSFCKSFNSLLIRFEAIANSQLSHCHRTFIHKVKDELQTTK